MPVEVGGKLGRYTLERLLGKGGMGEVYQGLDTELQRPVALKILSREFVDRPDRVRRFQQEAIATSALNHPNIVTIFELKSVGETYYIATEYVDGETLRGRIKDAARGFIPLNETLDIAAQVCDALAAAHEVGVIHRDIKPENIMVRRDGYVKVLDFGIAKLTEELRGRRTGNLDSLTQPGIVIGTVSYMSPEQARGFEVDPRSDIFSFGTVLYEMLTGNLPFVGASSTDIMAQILYHEPALPRMNLLATEIEAILRRTLAKQRDARYQTMKELAADLRNCRQQLAYLQPQWKTNSSLRETLKVEAFTPPQLSAHGSSPVPSHFTGVSGYSQSIHTSQTATRIDSIAILPLVNAAVDMSTEYLSDGITESLINALSQLPQLKVMARATVFRYKGQDADPQTVSRDLGVRAVLTGRVMQFGDNLIIKAELVDTFDGSQLWGEEYRRRAADIFEVQDEISREILKNLRLKLSGNEQEILAKHYTDNVEAYRFYLKGRFFLGQQTRDGMERSIASFQQAIALDPTYALAYAGISDAFYCLSSAYVPTNQAMPQARDAALQALAIDENLADAHASLALIKAFYEWDWTGAEASYQRALEINAGHAPTHHRYGWYLALTGRLSDAIRHIQRAAELDPLSAEITTDLGLSFFFGRQYDAAKQRFQKALKLEPDSVWTRVFIGWADEQQGNYAAAIEEYERARALEEVPLILSALCHAYIKSGNRARADELLAQLETMAQQTHVSSYHFAIIHAALGNLQAALEWLEKAFLTRAEALVWLKVDPRLDPLRTEPRFLQLIQRVGLSL